MKSDTAMPVPTKTPPAPPSTSSDLLRPSHSIMHQIPRALIVSAIAAGVDFALYALLVKLAGWHPNAAATVSYLLGGVVQYVLCSCWVFPAAPANAVIGFVAFSALSLVGLGITNGTIWVLCTRYGVDALFAKIAALGLAFCWNFTSRKYLIFRAGHRPHSPDGATEDA